MPSSGEPPRIELLQGTLDLIVLRTLHTMGAQHAYGIAARIEQVAEHPFTLNQGTLYPALVRLEQKGWITGTWGTTENNREAKYYTVTKAGTRALREQIDRAMAALGRSRQQTAPERVGMRAALRRLFRRLVNGLRPGQGEGDVARELASHLTLLEDECRRRGMSAHVARRAARIALGGVDQAKELHRDARAFVWVDDAVRDLRYVVRTLRNNVGFTMAVVVTIAVAISGLDAPAKAEMYVPYRQFSAQPWFAPRDLVVRTAGDPMARVGSITHEIHAVDPNLPVTHIRLATDILDEEVAARRVGTSVLVAFAAFSVLLAVVGIYGVISYFVVQHIPEIGVRIALGAQTRDILALVASRGVTLTLVGVGIGCVAAIAATRLVSSLLYGFSGFDPTAIVFASVLLVLLAVVASYVPARRATRLDPVVALRYR